MNKVKTLILALCVASISVFGQVTDLTFRPQITGNPDITAVAWQSDGKAIVAGNIVAVGDVPTPKIVRLMHDGTLDGSFSAPELFTGSVIWSINIQSNGKVVVAGGFLLDGMHMIRLNSDGSYDPTFRLAEKTDGVYGVELLPNGEFLIAAAGSKQYFKTDDKGFTLTSFVTASPNSYGVDGDMLVLPDGKILIGGPFTQWGNKDVAGLVRLNSDGSLDNTFSIGSGLSLYGTVKALALTSDGKIVVAGRFSSFNGTTCRNLVKLLPSGSLDPAFILPGPTANVLPGGVSNVAVIDNSIFVVGTAVVNNSLVSKVYKLTSDGAIDHSFAGLSMPLPDDYSSYYEEVLAIHESNLLLGYGFHEANGFPREAIVAFDASGTIDQNFNPAIRGAATLSAAALQPDGKIIIGGSFKYVGNTAALNLARLNPDGSVDEPFQMELGQGVNRRVRTIKILPGSQILIGGDFDKVNGANLPMLFRLNADGSRDNTFSAPLFARFVGLGVNAVELLGDGKILVGGMFSTSGTSGNLVRLEPTGALDNTFNVPLDDMQMVSSLAFQSDGKLLIGGKSFSNQTGFLLQTLPDGTLSNIFPQLDLSNSYPEVIRVKADDSFVFGGNFTSIFYQDLGVPIVQVTKEGEVSDMVSLSVAQGGLNDIHFTDDNFVLLAGSFKKINSADIEAAAKVKLNGAISAKFDLKVQGFVERIIRGEKHGEYYYIGSFGSFSDQPFFNIARVNVAIPSPPSMVAIQRDDAAGLIDITWADGSENETGFAIYRSTNGDNYLAIDTVAENVLTFEDNTALPLGSYSYKVKAFNAHYSSDFSNELSTTTAAWGPPNAPQDLTHDPIVAPFNSVELKWTDMADNEAGFEIERSVSNSPFTPFNTVSPNLQATTAEVDFDKQYAYRIRAYNRFGKSDYSNTLVLPIVVGLHDEEVAGVRLFPNPATTSFNLEVTSSLYSSCTIFTAEAVVAGRQNLDGRLTTISVADLRPGMYFLRLINGSESKTMKFIKK